MTSIDKEIWNAIQLQRPELLERFVIQLQEENQSLKSQLALCVEALEYYDYIYNERQTDANREDKTAKECLDKLAAMQSEGEK